MALWKITVLPLCLQSLTVALVPQSQILPDNMGKFCSKVDVCSETPRISKRAPPGTQQTVACCTACSCDDACVESNDCCFPPDDIHPDKECLYPTTTQDSDTLKKDYMSYRMVVKDENTELTNSHRQEVNKSCGEKLYPLVGSLLPVYSPQNRTIYKNPACAARHGVTDGVVWQPMIVCPNADGLAASRLNQALEYGFIPNFCYADFVYPGKKEDLKLHVCYKNLTRTCPEGPFPVPERLNITADRVRALCTSDFVSPAYDQDLFANVFCHICNLASVSWINGGSKHCLSRSGHMGNPSGKDALTQLLESYSFNKPRRSSEVAAPVACVESDATIEETLDMKNDDQCREVKCPQNHIRNAEGLCEFHSTGYASQMSVSTMVKINVDWRFDTKQDFDRRIAGLIQLWQTSQLWDGPFDIICEYEQDNTDLAKVKNLYMRTHILGESLKTKLNGIKSSMNTTLTLAKGQSMTQLHQTFADFSQFEAQSETIHGYSVVVPQWYKVIENASLGDLGISVPSMFMAISESFGFDTYRNVIYINKLHFCEQIELQPHEFISYLAPNSDGRPETWGGAIRNKLTQKFLFENEFWLLEKPNGEAIVRVCLEDSGFDKVIQKSGGATRNMSLIDILMALFATSVCCLQVNIFTVQSSTTAVDIL